MKWWNNMKNSNKNVVEISSFNIKIAGDRV